MTAGKAPWTEWPETMCTAFEHTVLRYPDAVALRGIDTDDLYTYSQYRVAIADVANALYGCGVRRHQVVALMFENRPIFHVVDSAATHLGAATCSIYNTSPPRDIAHVLESSGAQIVVSEAQFVARLREAAPDIRIICTDPNVVDAEYLGDLARSADFSFDDMWRLVEPDDVLTLIYTSGTTGPPKPVELTHRSMLAEIFLAAEMLDFRAGDRVPSALPMAHAAQRWGSHYNAMAFGLEVVCIHDLATLGQSLVLIQPEIWGTVPRILEKMVAAVQLRLDSESDPDRRALVNAAVDTGQRYADAVQAARAGGADPPPELVAQRRDAEAVLGGIRKSLGLANVRWLMVGAAPTPPHIHAYLASLGLEVVEVWGMSELGAVAAMNPVGAQRAGTVGKPLRNVEVTLADDGEIMVRGPIVMRGYRGLPEATAEAFTEDGRLRTGDLGAIDADGYLSITGRKKEIIINAAGKNISPVKVESAVKAQSPLIGSVMVVGDGRPFLTALIVLDPDALAQFAVRAGLAESAPVDLATSDVILTEVGEAVDRANAQLARVEQIKVHEVLPDFWLPAGDELTPTLKLKRRVISEKYSERIDALYAAATAAP
jgi:long-subunit acyl-CoA synthetase (AMP-forming)